MASAVSATEEGGGGVKQISTSGEQQSEDLVEQALRLDESSPDLTRRTEGGIGLALNCVSVRGVNVNCVSTNGVNLNCVNACGVVNHRPVFEINLKPDALIAVGEEYIAPEHVTNPLSNVSRNSANVSGLRSNCDAVNSPNHSQLSDCKSIQSDPIPIDDPIGSIDHDQQLLIDNQQPIIDTGNSDLIGCPISGSLDSCRQQTIGHLNIADIGVQIKDCSLKPGLTVGDVLTLTIDGLALKQLENSEIHLNVPEYNSANTRRSSTELRPVLNTGLNTSDCKPYLNNITLNASTLKADLQIKLNTGDLKPYPSSTTLNTEDLKPDLISSGPRLLDGARINQSTSIKNREYNRLLRAIGDALPIMESRVSSIADSIQCGGGINPKVKLVEVTGLEEETTGELKTAVEDLRAYGADLVCVFELVSLLIGIE